MLLYLYKIQLHLPKMLTVGLPMLAKGNKRFMDLHSEIEYNKIDLVVELVVHCIDIFILFLFLPFFFFDHLLQKYQMHCIKYFQIKYLLCQNYWNLPIKTHYWYSKIHKISVRDYKFCILQIFYIYL